MHPLANARWFYQLLGDEFGPVPWESVQQLLDDGVLTLTDRVRCEGQKEWLTIQEMQRFCSNNHLHSSQHMAGSRGSADVQPEWYCKVAGIELGPMLFSDLIQMAQRGELSSEDEVRYGANNSWRQAGRVSKLAAYLPYSETHSLRPHPVPPLNLDSPQSISSPIDNLSKPDNVLESTGSPSAREKPNTMRLPSAQPVNTGLHPVEAKLSPHSAPGTSSVDAPAHRLAPASVQPSSSVSKVPPESSTEPANRVNVAQGLESPRKFNEAVLPVSPAPISSVSSQSLWASTTASPSRIAPRSARNTTSKLDLAMVLNTKTLGTLAAIVLVVGIWFARDLLPRSTAADRQKLETLQALYQEFCRLRDTKASESAWKDFEAKSRKVVEPMAEELSRTANRREPQKQYLLWAAKYRWKELIQQGRHQEVAAEKDFVRNLQEAGRRMQMNVTLKAAESTTVIDDPPSQD